VNYYERHIGDYLKDTAHLSLLEHGIYGRLLDVYYVREGAIPVDQAARLVGARSEEEGAALQSVLTEFFTLCGEAWTHKRCEEEIARCQDKTAKAKASAEMRWAHTERIAKAMPTHSEGNAPNNQEPITKKEREPRATRLASGWELPADWGNWAAQARPDLDPLKTAERFADYWRGKPGKDGRKLDWEATWRNWVRDERAPKANPADVARVTVPFKASPNSALEQMKRDVMTPEQEAAAEAARLAVMAKLKPIKAAA
jgi:uncharacterized protein YdaU (DUF1376 family)